MEPYRGYGRGMYGRGMNQCDTTRRSSSGFSNTCNPKKMPDDCGCKKMSDDCGCKKMSDDCGCKKISDDCGCKKMSDDYSRRMMPEDCGCKDDNRHMRNMPLAMGFVQMQEWERLYNPDDALRNGTAFPCLDLIFCGARGKM